MPALNWANCWKPLSITQSAGNLKFLKTQGIFRDYTPSCICYLHLYKNKYKKNFLKKNICNYIYTRQFSALSTINNINISSNIDKFSYYLTGLIEGDGTIIVPKTERTKNRFNYPSIQIVFHLKDLPLALIIQKELKHGSLSRKKGVNAYILTINNKKGLLLLISLINGKMRTPKIYSLYNLIDWYNSKNSGIFIEKKELNNLPLNSTPWLSGFIEADGHFSVRSTLSGIECKFELCQRQIDHKGHDNLKFLEDIAEFLNTTVKVIRTNRINPEYRVRTVNLKGNTILEDYLSTFPLFGCKYLDCLDWLLVLSLFKSGKVDHKLNIDNVLKIKLRMNDKRTIYIWDHLKNFYSLDT